MTTPQWVERGASKQECHLRPFPGVVMTLQMLCYTQGSFPEEFEGGFVSLGLAVLENQPPPLPATGDATVTSVCRQCAIKQEYHRR